MHHRIDTLAAAARNASGALAAACGFALALAAPPAAAGSSPVASRFDSGAEGWTVRNLLPPQEGGEAATYLPGPGRIRTQPDPYPWTVFSAPAAFLGDMSAYAGGTIAFELSDTLRDADAERFPTLLLRSGPSYLAWLGGAPETDLTSFRATLAPSAQWLIGMSPLAAAPATAADFALVLASVDAVYINADWRTAGADVAELDNVVLAADVPEPPMAALWAAGLAGLAALGRSGRRRTGSADRAGGTDRARSTDSADSGTPPV
jgi:hypothetical protein